MRAVAGAAAAMALAGFPLDPASAADPHEKARRILFLHEVRRIRAHLHPAGDGRGGAEPRRARAGRGRKQHGFDVVPTKDGGTFTPERLQRVRPRRVLHAGRRVHAGRHNLRR